MDHWIDLPFGFADMAQASAWSKSLDQAQRRLELLRLIELVFRIETLFSAYPEIASVSIDPSRETDARELTVFVEREGGLAELSSLRRRLSLMDRVSALGPLSDWERLEGMQATVSQADALMRQNPEMLSGAQALWPYRSARVERCACSWRDICHVLGAQAASRAIERAQIERETQTGSSAGPRSI